MEKHGNRRVNTPSTTSEEEDSQNEKLEDYMALLQDAIDSPQTHFILRNAVLALLEAAKQSLNLETIYALLTRDEIRNSLVQRLKTTTPEYWSKDWNRLWKKDEEPLLSAAQQRIVARTSLIVFWSKEWTDTPETVKSHVADIVAELMKPA